MTIPQNTRTDYFERMLEIARRSGVQVHFISNDPHRNLEWDGLYLCAPQMGAGIALRDDLAPEERDWVLAHELGHHFSQLSLRLFSPFCAHMVDTATRKRWRGGTLHPDEERANNWAIKTLFERSHWADAEATNPCDLRAIVTRLKLPMSAALAWNRRERGKIRSGRAVAVRFGADEWRQLHRSVAGSGGHQSLFRRVLRRPSTREAMIDFNDFTLARERVFNVRGGWLKRYRILLDGIEPLIVKAGGVNELFRCTFADPDD